MEKLIAHYRFDEEARPGEDASGHEFHARVRGSNAPYIGDVAGRRAAIFAGGLSGTAYFELPEGIFQTVGDEDGITVTAWVYFNRGTSAWERIFDFGRSQHGPYLFLTRNLRGVCFLNGDIAVDPMSAYPFGEWMHVAMVVSGTQGKTLSSAGPCIYVNGEMVADGTISQTTSGTYKRLYEWFETFQTADNYCHSYIGKSQFDADGDFSGAISDFRIYSRALNGDEIADMVCEVLTDEEIISKAAEKHLHILQHIITDELELPASLMQGRVSVEWESSQPAMLDILTQEAGSIFCTAKVKEVEKPTAVSLTAHVIRGKAKISKELSVTVIPKEISPYTLTIYGDKPVLDISETLYGLFYEDINNAADGGLYAEMVRNRSFEAFTYDTYDSRSGENGRSTGRNRVPLEGWYGDLDKVSVQTWGGLDEVFQHSDPDGNVTYITAPAGTVITNRGFSDMSGNFAMKFVKGENYDFTVWAKAESNAVLSVRLLDAAGSAVSNSAEIKVDGGWKKYGVDKKLVLTAEKDCMGQLELTFLGELSVDMVSMFPRDVWGADEEADSATAHANYSGNSNYRLRRDLVEAMRGLHPTFLRFPGGCISEGSYIWDNVYDWKDSVGDVEVRKENYNVWGYMMTLGLGYMEYFQLAEDLQATPLPVMACGVLCQARSDYANPAGGALQEKYIRNFTDLIDFAISTDYENNIWAALRKKMGHAEPFDLHYLGVGNENWGEEFYASFEEFYERITSYVKKKYPGYKLSIISTVGAQADDNSYQEGWKFLSGNMPGGAKVRFTDGRRSFEKDVKWYRFQKDFMETIVDEHYYRSNDYLLENADRYNYYARAYKQDGTVEDARISKVFVGEYASTDKNTLAGAVAEAAVMTGFERNSDVVRLAATAPLFNKVLTDSTYRWTPDCIWFDDETFWRTPNYYVQQMFAKYLGKKLLHTSFATYYNGQHIELFPSGAVEVTSNDADILIKRLTVVSNRDKSILFEQDFKNKLSGDLELFPETKLEQTEQGILLSSDSGQAGIRLRGCFWNCTVTAVMERVKGQGGFSIGVGSIGSEKDQSVIRYVVGQKGKTAVTVMKNGVEGYTLGDFSAGTAAGNLRAALDEKIQNNVEYTLVVNYGEMFEKPGVPFQDTLDSAVFRTGGYISEGYGAYPHLICSHQAAGENSLVLDYKLEAYNRDIFQSVTGDEKKIYTKLVNTDSYEKQVELVFKEAENKPLSGDAEWVCLTGKEELVDVLNVNQRGNEIITPHSTILPVKNGKLTVTLPGNSISVIITPRS